MTSSRDGIFTFELQAILHCCLLWSFWLKRNWEDWLLFHKVSECMQGSLALVDLRLRWGGIWLYQTEGTTQLVVIDTSRMLFIPRSQRKHSLFHGLIRPVQSALQIWCAKTCWKAGFIISATRNCLAITRHTFVFATVFASISEPKIISGYLIQCIW